MFSKSYCPFTTHNPLLTAVLQIVLLCLCDLLVSGATPNPFPRTDPTIAVAIASGHSPLVHGGSSGLPKHK
ncbi:MAG: hypothetical protein WCD18_08630 [Thermosynechococcaceae cyanobacterium]